MRSGVSRMHGASAATLALLVATTDATVVDSTYALRAALANGTSPITLLPQRYILDNQLLVHQTKVELHGEGAVLDAQGVTRHFDVAHGGNLLLDGATLVNGGGVDAGGAVQVRSGGHARLQNVSVAHCVAHGAAGAGARGGAVAAWEPRVGLEQLAAPNASDGMVTWSIAFAADGHYLASGDETGAIRVWRTDSLEVVAGVDAGRQGGGDSVITVALSADGKTLVSGSGDGIASAKLCLWNVSNDHLDLVANATVGDPGDLIMSVAFSPDGNHVVSGSDIGSGEIILWDAADLSLLTRAFVLAERHRPCIEPGTSAANSCGATIDLQFG